MTNILKAFILAIVLVFPAHAAKKPTAEFNRFAAKIAKQYRFNQKQVVDLLTKAEEIRPVQTSIAQPVTNLPWYKFKPLFVNQRRIDNGVKFWDEHEAALNRASQEYGVPVSIIVSIIGIETKYGATIGNFRVFDALTTLAFYTPKARKEYFRTELVEFMLVAREQGWNPREVYGSYAGALGLPQFMPSSYRHYAVDFDGDGKIDLMHNVSDAIGSIGSYMKRRGWQQGMPIAMLSDCKTYKGEKLSLKPSLTMKQWAEKCDVIVVDADDYPEYSYPATLFLIETENGVQYWNGFNNFFSIIRYNPSINYAMAVMTLSEEIESARSNRRKENELLKTEPPSCTDDISCQF